MPIRTLSASRSLLSFAGLFLCLPGLAVSQQEYRTQPELSEFREYTSYESMMTYLADVQASSTEMRLGIYGESHQGRELPYSIFARPSITRPWEAWALGKPILVLAANVHGNEPTFRESLLILLRDFATPGTEMNDALDELTVIIVPQLNPDGFSTPDPQRGNIWGLDLNRDYMKLEQPEIQSYVENLLLPWAPHLVVDGHNSGTEPYNLYYQCPSHAATDPRITELCDELIFPAMDRKLATEGFSAWYYQRGNETRWDVGGSDPRIGRNYGGFSNSVGILLESGRGQSVSEGIRSGVLAYETVVEWSRSNTELLMETVQRARVETVQMGAAPVGEVPIEIVYEPEDESVTYRLVRETEDGRRVVEIQSDSLMKRPVVMLTRPRPWAYLLPPGLEEAVQLLRRHGVQVEVLQEQTDLIANVYTIDSITYEQAYNHDAAVKVDVAETITREASLDSGWYVVRTGQMRGRIAAHLLEAETRDGVVFWNRMDPWLPKNEVEAFKVGTAAAPEFPILKLMDPTPLRTRILP